MGILPREQRLGPGNAGEPGTGAQDEACAVKFLAALMLTLFHFPVKAAS